MYENHKMMIVIMISVMMINHDDNNQVKTVLSMYQKHKVSVGSLTGQVVSTITIMTISLFFYDDYYYTMISFVSTVGEENLRRDNGKVC